jgi:hypothetical protein
MTTLKTLLALLAAAAILTCIPGCDDVRSEIQGTLDRAMDAKRKGDAFAFLRELDAETLQDYDRRLAAARSATGDQIRRLPAIDRYSIAVIRATATPEQLRTLDARSLIRTSFTAWDTGAESDGAGRPADITLGIVRHKAPRADVQLVVNGVRTTLWLEFVKVEDRWYLSTRAFDEWFNQQVAARARRLDRSEEYVILQLARLASGKNFDARIWER